MGKRKISAIRLDRIVNKLSKEGRVKVNELSRDLGVSPITIRRDLELLSEQGNIERIHGGALLRQSENPETHLTEKGHQYILEKKAIARKVVELIEEGQTIFLNSGSTTLEVVKQIKDKYVKIITNNAAVLKIKRDPLVEIFLVGGEFRESSQSLVGDMAIHNLAEIYSDCSILGTNSISVEKGLTSSVQQETGVNRTMIEHTNGPIFLVADSSKIGSVSNFPTVAISKINTLITDDKVKKEDVIKLEQAGIKVIIASYEAE